MTTTSLSLGSYSHGTMNAGSLIQRFLPAAHEVAPDKAVHLQTAYERLCAEDNDEGTEDLLDELFDLLNAHCPPYTYFGAHEGDGSDYGVWIDWESLEEDLREGSVDPEGSLGDADYIAVLDSRGEITALYDRATKQQLWAL
jgi:hypothetical protein